MGSFGYWVPRVKDTVVTPVPQTPELPCLLDIIYEDYICSPLENSRIRLSCPEGTHQTPRFDRQSVYFVVLFICLYLGHLKDTWLLV